MAFYNLCSTVHHSKIINVVQYSSFQFCTIVCRVESSMSDIDGQSVSAAFTLISQEFEQSGNWNNLVSPLSSVRVG